MWKGLPKSLGWKTRATNGSRMHKVALFGYNTVFVFSLLSQPVNSFIRDLYQWWTIIGQEQVSSGTTRCHTGTCKLGCYLGVTHGSVLRKADKLSATIILSILNHYQENIGTIFVSRTTNNLMFTRCRSSAQWRK